MTTHDQMLRKQFERELAAEQAIDPAVLCCTAEGAYADARIQQDWIHYQRAWWAAGKTIQRLVQTSVEQAPSLAFWANIRQLEAGDPQLAWKLLSQQIERIVLLRDQLRLDQLLQSLVPERHRIETVTMALALSVMSYPNSRALIDAVLRAQKHFANAPDSQAKGLLTRFKVHSR